MWIFTSNSFISVVADRNDPETGRMLVRSRDRSHISNLFPNAEIFSKTPSDYKWRAWVSREELKKVLDDYVSSLNYDNFKNSIEDDTYHDACVGVWNEMYLTYQ